MNEPVGLATPHTSVSAPDSPDFWCRQSTRLLLFFLHFILLIAALSLTPRTHAFELGAAVGLVLIFGCLFSWVVLYHAQSRTLVGIFAGVAIAQLVFIAFVGLHFRSEDKALQAVIADAVRQREQEAAAMAPFSMDPLFEMCSGTRPLSQQELVELRLRAQRGRAKLQEFESTNKQWLVQMDTRLRTVGPGVAREFREGVASSQRESDEIMKISQDYFIEAEQLAAFLIDHQHQYHETRTGLVFDKPEDERAFNHHIDSIARLQEQFHGHAQKAEEGFKQLQH
jgi:hypothetical protein